jgi:hypothetical protein
LRIFKNNLVRSKDKVIFFDSDRFPLRQKDEFPAENRTHLRQKLTQTTQRGAVFPSMCAGMREIRNFLAEKCMETIIRFH